MPAAGQQDVRVLVAIKPACLRLGASASRSGDKVSVWWSK